LRKPRKFNLKVASELSNLSVVADFIVKAARSCGLNERQTEDVHMAVDEAVTNVMEHAYRGRRDGEIFIKCERRGDEFVVEIQDFGKLFDASKVRTPRVHGPLSRRTIGGLGIFFMKQLMDQVEFASDAQNGNRVRMVKRIKQ
jgi:serine/threonine-protein kinase RsbW